MSEYLLQSAFLLLALERRLGSQQDVKYHPTTPYIALISKIALDNLWRHIADSAYQLGAFNAGFVHLERTTKIEQLYFHLVGL